MPNLTKEQYEALPAKVEMDKGAAYQLQGEEYVPVTDALGRTVHALESERHGRSTEAGELAAYKALGYTAADAKKLVAKAKEMDKWTPEDKVREQMEAFRDQLTTQYTEKEKAHLDRIARREAQLDRVLVDGSLSQAIGAAGNPKMLIPAMRGRITVMEDERTGERVTRILGPDGKTPRLSMKNPGQYMGPDELVEEFRSDKDWAAAFNGHGAQGAGSNGSRMQGGPLPGGLAIKRSEIDNRQVFAAKIAEAQKLGIKPADIPVIEGQ